MSKPVARTTMPPQVETSVVTTNPATGEISIDGVAVAVTKVGNTDTTVNTTRVYLGVEIMTIDDAMAQALKLSSDNGVLVNMVVPDSPAQKAGLRRGDVIFSLDNKIVKDVETFKEILAKYNPGDRVKIVYIRNNSRALAYAYLTAFPALQKTAATADFTSPSGWGVSLSPLSNVIRTTYNIPANITGIAILAVEPGGVADKAGLSAGDVIMSVNKTAIKDLDEFFNAIAASKNDTALLDIYSQGTYRYVPIDATAIKLTTTTTQATGQSSVTQKLFSIFTGGAPFTSSNITQTADSTTAFNRPTTVVGDTTTGGTSTGGSSPTTSTTGMNRPSQVPSQSTSPNNDIVLFIGLLILIILAFGYREYHRPSE